MDDLKAKQQLQDMVNNIAHNIQHGMTYDEAEMDHEANGCEPDDQISGYDYLQDCLDIQYIVTGASEYLGARVLVAFGGPNIWINTKDRQVEGYWWGDNFTLSYKNDEMGIHDCEIELIGC